MQEEERKWCVYCHKNKTNGKCYVGITSYKPEKRWGKNGYHYRKQYFYRAINKYSWDGFEHIILHKNLKESVAKEKEIYYIKLYNSKSPNGYNLTDGGDGNAGIQTSEETIEKLRKSHIGQVEWNKGLKGKYIQKESTKESHLLKWKEEQYSKKQTLSHMGNKQSEETKRKISKNNANAKKILQIDLSGNIVKEWNSIAEINRDIYYVGKNIKTKIYPLCVRFDNCIWIRKEDYSENLLRDIFSGKAEIKKKEYKCTGNGKKVVLKYDKDMNLIKEYKSVKSTAIENNINMTTIRKYIKSGKIYGSFYFKTKETNEK